MRTLLAAPCLLVGLSLAPLGALRAEEPAPKHPLDTWVQVWKAGDVATYSSDDTMKIHVLVEGTNPADGEPFTQVQEQLSRKVAVYAAKALEVDERGSPTRRHVYVKSWTQKQTTTQGGEPVEAEPDTSLEGALLEVVWKDGVHAHRLLNPGITPSEDAKKWLDHQFGKEEKRQPGRLLDMFGRPPGPVAVGQSWRGDPANLDFPLPIDLSASKLELTLKSADERKYTLLGKLDLKLTGFPLGDGGLVAPFSEGGNLGGTFTLVEAIGPGALGTDLDLTMGLKGKAGFQGMTLTVELEFAGKMRMTSGGEVPEPPTLK